MSFCCVSFMLISQFYSCFWMILSHSIYICLTNLFAVKWLVKIEYLSYYLLCLKRAHATIFNSEGIFWRKIFNSELIFIFSRIFKPPYSIWKKKIEHFWQLSWQMHKWLPTWFWKGKASWRYLEINIEVSFFFLWLRF